MYRLAVQLVALVLIVVGLILFPLPIPFGLALIVIGLAMLVSSSPATARWLKGIRRRNRGTDRAIRTIETGLPEVLAGPLRTTDPDQPDDEPADVDGNGDGSEAEPENDR